MKPHLVVIARNLTNGGVTRAIRHFIAEFDKNTEFEITLIHNEKMFQETTFQNITPVYIPTRSKLLFDLFVSFWELLKRRPDHVLYTKNVIPLTHHVLPVKKSIITYDVGYLEKDLGAYKWQDTVFMKAFMKMSAKASNHVFTISHFTKSRIEALFGINSDKIVVTHLASDVFFNTPATIEEQQKTQQDLDLKTPFMFYAGSISPRKNLTRLLQAFDQLADKIPHNLYITGINTWGNLEEFNQIQEKYPNRIHLLGFVSEQDLRSLYSLADMYVFPSLYEGFGLPILEAQAQGTPVVTANQNSCKEVAGESTLLVDPMKVEDIASAIHTLATDENLHKELVKKGEENLKRFSWSNSANLILQTIQKG